MSGTFSKTYTGAATWQLGLAGKLFRILSAPTALDLTFYRNNAVVASAVAVDTGFFLLPDGGFDRVDVYSSVAQTVKLLIVDGDGGYDHFNVDITSALSAVAVTISGAAAVTIGQAGTVTNPAAVSVGVAATALVAANAARRGVRFYNAGTVDVYLGGAGVTVGTGGVKIAAGQFWAESEAAAAAWYGVSGTAAQSVQIQELT